MSRLSRASRSRAGSPLGAGSPRGGSPCGDRFEARLIRPADPAACWGWLGAQDVAGRPRFAGTLATRVAWTRLVGPIPPGYELARRPGCPGGVCTNPAHVTCVPRGTSVRRRLQGNTLAARLTWGQVRAIRAAAGHESQGTLAARYSVSRATVSTIVRGVSWQEVPP